MAEITSSPLPEERATQGQVACPHRQSQPRPHIPHHAQPDGDRRIPTAISPRPPPRVSLILSPWAPALQQALQLPTRSSQSAALGGERAQVDERTKQLDAEAVHHPSTLDAEAVHHPSSSMQRQCTIQARSRPPRHEERRAVQQLATDRQWVDHPLHADGAQAQPPRWPWRPPRWQPMPSLLRW